MCSTRRRKLEMICDTNLDALNSTNKFPGKLWRIVNDCTTGAIRWGDDGKTIVLNKSQFQREYLDAPNKCFKTNNIGSFIRQLNLYGFKKVQPSSRQFTFDYGIDQDVQEFQSDSFVKGQPELVTELRRHVGVRRAREQAAKRRHAMTESFDSHDKTARADVLRLYDYGYQRTFVSSGSRDSGGVSYAPKGLHPSKPCMLAVPVYPDGVPRIHPGVPPVLVEWDGKIKEWVAAGPAYSMNKTETEELISGHDSLNNISGEQFNRLVKAVSDALQNPSESEDLSCPSIGGWSSDGRRSDSPSSLESNQLTHHFVFGDSSATVALDMPKSVEKMSEVPTPNSAIKPGSSMLHTILPVSKPFSFSVSSPEPCPAAPVFSPDLPDSARLPSPITSKDVDFSAYHDDDNYLSSMSVNYNIEGPCLSLSPINVPSESQRICLTSDLGRVDFVDISEDDTLFSMDHIYEV